MGKYLVYYSKLLKTNLAYASNFLFSNILDLVFFLAFFFLWKSVYHDSNSAVISGYTLSSLLTYYFATEFIFRFDVVGAIYLNWDIWEGTFSNWIIKPIRMTLLYIADPIVEKTLVALMAVPAYVVIYLVAQNYIRLPDISNWLFFIVTLFLSFLLNILFNLIFHAFCFKHGDQDNNIELVNYIVAFLAGGFFPLTFIPGKIGEILNLLPFKYLINVPANVFLGRYSPKEIILGWITMLFWIAVCYLFYKRTFKEGLKYYTGVGR